MYYVEDKNSKVILRDEMKENIKNALEFMPQYAGLKIKG